MTERRVTVFPAPSSQVLTAAALLAVAGAPALAQNNYIGGGPNGNWSTAANWQAVGAGSAGPPAAGGGVALNLFFKAATGAAWLPSVQDRGNPFDLKTLTLEQAAGGGFTIFPAAANASVLRFNGPGSSLANNATDRIHMINVPINMVGGDLTVGGNANESAGDAAQLQLNGVINSVAGIGLFIDTAGSAEVLLSRANNHGGTRLNRGSLVLGNNSCLGIAAGAFQVNNVNGTRKIRASTDGAIQFANPWNVQGDLTVGDTFSNNYIRCTGTTTLTGNRTFTIPNPKARLKFGGPIVTTANDGLFVVGSVAPTPDANNPKRFKSPKADNLGSTVEIEADCPNFRGPVSVVNGTIRLGRDTVVNGRNVRASATIGTVAAPAASFTIGDGNTPAGVTGFGFVRTAAKLDQKKKAIIDMGDSPGILGVNGPGMIMRGGSGIVFSIDGPTPGNGTDTNTGPGSGYHSQLQLQTGELNLELNGLGERPAITVLKQNPFRPLALGTRYAVVWVADPSKPPLPNQAPPSFFSTPSGVPLFQNAIFTSEDGSTWQIDYFGNTDSSGVAISGFGNDVVLTLLGLAPRCNLADIVSVGGFPPSDGILTGDDYVAFINAFAAGDPLADVCGVGGPPNPPDGLITGDDFVAFINAFVSGC